MRTAVSALLFIGVLTACGDLTIEQLGIGGVGGVHGGPGIVNPAGTTVDSGVGQEGDRPVITEIYSERIGEPSRRAIGIRFNADPYPWTEWMQVRGPGVVSFEDANWFYTHATFSVPGTYLLRASIENDLGEDSEELFIFIEAE